MNREEILKRASDSSPFYLGSLKRDDQVQVKDMVDEGLLRLEKKTPRKQGKHAKFTLIRKI